MGRARTGNTDVAARQTDTRRQATHAKVQAREGRGLNRPNTAFNKLNVIISFVDTLLEMWLFLSLGLLCICG